MDIVNWNKKELQAMQWWNSLSPTQQRHFAQEIGITLYHGNLMPHHYQLITGFYHANQPLNTPNESSSPTYEEEKCRRSAQEMFPEKPKSNIAQTGVYLYDEREQLLRLAAENDELKSDSRLPSFDCVSCTREKERERERRREGERPAL